MFSTARPYIDLVSKNRDYRRLWLSQMVSNFGDWFGILAVYALIQQYSSSEFLLGLIIVVKMVSLASFSPIAGHITDRYNLRKLMLWCDILRGVIVLGFLLVVSAGTLWLAYVLTALQMVLSAVFEPAKRSSIPNVTTPEELVNANILSAASWSIIFTTGMALGGVATGYLGTDAVFVINSLSYLLSGWFIFRAVIPQSQMSEEERVRTRNPVTGILEGFRFLKQNPRVLRPALAKGTFTVCSGALVYMLIIVAEDILLMGSIGLGFLYAARGVGTGIGPVFARRMFRDEARWVQVMGYCMIFSGLFYFLVGVTASLVWMLVFVMFAHMASGANWVMSTVLLQRRAPDIFRGRSFSTEWLLFTLSQSISVTAASLILEFGWLSLREAIGLYAMLLCGLGLFWLFRIAPADRTEAGLAG